jgi:hypothetical protein
MSVRSPYDVIVTRPGLFFTWQGCVVFGIWLELDTSTNSPFKDPETSSCANSQIQQGHFKVYIFARFKSLGQIQINEPV